MEFMKKNVYILLIILLNSTLLWSQNIVLNNDKTRTNISYELRHPAHIVKASSNDLQVKIEYDKTNNSILNVIAQVRVSTFDSGNSNRDSHAMELIEATKYPKTQFKSSKIVEQGDSLTIYGDLTFHNVTKNITIKGTKKLNNNNLSFSGRFAISLDDFKVERPKLLFVPSEEYLRFEINTEFSINQ